MRKQDTYKEKISRATRLMTWSRAAYMALAVVMAASMAVSGCSKKGSQPAGTGVETEAPMELHLTCYLTGTNVFTDAEGKEQTSVRFLVENDDTANKDWVKGINGKEYLKARNESVQVYSRYINDNCRYVDGTIPGNMNTEDITYSAGTFTSSGWEQAGDAQYKEIGAIVEEGIPYFYTGCGVSTGLAGERVMCVWLVGFTPDSVPVDGERPQITKADRFSLVTASGEDIPAWEGMAKEPELSANEFGIEVSIQAEDQDMLLRSVARTGLVLRHEGLDGTITDFELEMKTEGEILEEDRPEDELEDVDEGEAIQREGFGESIFSDENMIIGEAGPEEDAEDTAGAENPGNGENALGRSSAPGAEGGED